MLNTFITYLRTIDHLEHTPSPHLERQPSTTEQVDGAFSLILDQFHLVERNLHCLVGKSDLDIGAATEGSLLAGEDANPARVVD